MLELKPRRGAPPKREAVIHAAALDTIATLDEQELDELHPAERLVEPLTSLVMQMVNEPDPMRREAYGARAMTYLHALHDHVVKAEADNHRADNCVYCMLAQSGATFLDAASLVRADHYGQRLTAKLAR